MEGEFIQYPQENGLVKAQFLLKTITTKLEGDHPGFTTIATQQTQTGQGRNVSKFASVIDIITKAIQNKIMQFKNVSGWDSIYYDDISTAIPTYGVLDSIIEELEKNQTIKDIIIKAKEKKPEVLITSVTPHGNQDQHIKDIIREATEKEKVLDIRKVTPHGNQGGRKMRKSSKRHRKSNKKHRKGNKKHKKSIKKHRR